MLRSRLTLFYASSRKKYTSVAECYEGQSLLITGSTGFVGKVLLEKLLYQCPKIDKVYLLLREKKNIKPHQRISKILDEPVFSRLIKEKPQMLDKIVPIAGDISSPDLAMKTQDQQLLINKVSMVFHAAASVLFNDPLDIAMNINFGGTERVLNLCLRMKTIKSFLHVSTAYCNTDKPIIEEIVYPAPASINKVNELLAKGLVNKDEVKKLLNKQPNTYAFAKALAENLVLERHGNIPTTIIRPTIVSASKNEPVVGWLDNWFGITGHMALTLLGINRVLLGNPNNILDIVPVDYVANLIIVAAATNTNCKDVKVYNCSTSKVNPITLYQLKNLTFEDNKIYKANVVPFPSLLFTSSKWVESLIILISNTIPAYFMDTMLILQGKKPRYRNFFSKVSRQRKAMDYFSSNTWEICAAKTRSLATSLSATDKQNFPFDPIDIDWKDYIPNYCKGIRQFMLKRQK
ncbi:unnamed protein product, partial [Brenthis ino]